MNKIERYTALVVLGMVLAASITIAGGKHGETTSKGHEDVNPYPLKTCLVSGEGLNSMGGPQTMVFKQEIKFCCKGCVKDFKKDPLKYVAKLAAAAQAHKSKSTEHGHEGSATKKIQKHDHSGHSH